MKEFHQKMLWIAVPTLLATLVPLMSQGRIELTVLCWGLLILVAAFGIWTCGARERRKEADALEKRRWDDLNKRLDMGDRADRVLLRNELVRMHREWAEEEGFISLEALEYAENTYETYHALGGNGSGTKLWEDIRNLPVKR